MRKNNLALIFGAIGSGKTTLAFSMLENDKRVAYLSRYDESKENQSNATFICSDGAYHPTELIKEYLQKEEFDTILLDETDSRLQDVSIDSWKEIAKEAADCGKNVIIASHSTSQSMPSKSNLCVLYY